jgi:hypothetical protein
MVAICRKLKKIYLLYFIGDFRFGKNQKSQGG